MKVSNKIIGGEFAIPYELTQLKEKKEINTQGNSFYSSGRCALYTILKDIEQQFGKTARRILLPNYLCDSITNTVIDSGWNYSFYHVGKDFHIDHNGLCTLLLDKTVILLIDYFGMTDLTDDILKLRKKYPKVVIVSDCVQAFYSLDKYDVDYSFTSFRKWFPCPDGALVLKKAESQIVEIDMKPSLWQQYKYAGGILKCFPEYVDDEIILELLEKGEDILNKNYLSEWDETSQRIFLNIDTEIVKEKRKQNAKFLHERLSEMNINHLYVENATPLFIPILVNNRDELRRAFFKECIFTPKHWPITSEGINGINELYDIELSLICDQRYTLADMEAQIRVIKKISKG